MPLYAKKPVIVEMIQWVAEEGARLDDTIKPLRDFIAPQALSLARRPDEHGDYPVVTFYVAKGQSTCEIEIGDWIARECDGDGFYPITRDAQADAYVPAYVSAEIEEAR